VLTLLLGGVLLVAVVPLPIRVASEIQSVTTELREIERSGVLSKIGEIPFVGDYLVEAMRSVVSDPAELSAAIEEHRAGILSFATAAVRGVLSTIITTLASLIGCYFLYRYGETLVAQLRTILVRIGGPKVPSLLDTVHLTVKGAAYSVLATAFAQGLLAGIGYSVAGAPVPLLLALLTTVFSLIPFGPPLIYLPVCAYLIFVSGEPWYYGVGLAAWAILVVSTIDNILRPFFISQKTKLPGILVFIGVLGGVLCFGLLGVFVGPVLLAIAQWLWIEFSRPVSADEQTPNLV
jgi:hypothetical protein